MAQIKYIDQQGLQQAIAALKGKTDAAYLAKDGVAKSAEKLNAAVKINGVDFDGSAAIDIPCQDHEHAIEDVDGLQDALDAKLEEVKAEDLEYTNTNMTGVGNVKGALDTLAGVNVQMVADIEAIEEAIGAAATADDEATGLHKVIADADAVVLEAARQDAANQITALVDSAPEAMNTLKELATAISAHQTVYDGYVAQVAQDIANAQSSAEAKAAQLDEVLAGRIQALENAEVDTHVALTQSEIEAAINNAWV